MKKISFAIFFFTLCQTNFAQNTSYRYQGQVINLQTDSLDFVVFNSNTITGGG